jgi:hypothetical protein
MFVIIHGSLLDGHVFTGPFTSEEAAHDWADNLVKVGVNYEVVPLQNCGDAMDWQAPKRVRV